jgi:hypothetical protein
MLTREELASIAFYLRTLAAGAYATNSATTEIKRLADRAAEEAARPEVAS